MMNKKMINKNNQEYQLIKDMWEHDIFEYIHTRVDFQISVEIFYISAEEITFSLYFDGFMHHTFTRLPTREWHIELDKIIEAVKLVQEASGLLRKASKVWPAFTFEKNIPERKIRYMYKHQCASLTYGLYDQEKVFTEPQE